MDLQSSHITQLTILTIFFAMHSCEYVEIPQQEKRRTEILTTPPSSPPKTSEAKATKNLSAARCCLTVRGAEVRRRHCLNFPMGPITGCKARATKALSAARHCLTIQGVGVRRKRCPNLPMSPMPSTKQSPQPWGCHLLRRQKSPHPSGILSP